MIVYKAHASSDELFDNWEMRSWLVVFVEPEFGAGVIGEEVQIGELECSDEKLAHFGSKFAEVLKLYIYVLVGNCGLAGQCLAHVYFEFLREHLL